MLPADCLCLALLPVCQQERDACGYGGEKRQECFSHICLSLLLLIVLFFVKPEPCYAKYREQAEHRGVGIAHRAHAYHHTCCAYEHVVDIVTACALDVRQQLAACFTAGYGCQAKRYCGGDDERGTGVEHGVVGVYSRPYGAEQQDEPRCGGEDGGGVCHILCHKLLLMCASHHQNLTPRLAYTNPRLRMPAVCESANL